ncbi:MAG: biotin--[acetyl-CoA-carboxylase] ligase [Pirellulales bacterium]|nr:biotin--[acetyl-CoA-carboxylase] ligase [Pirellulales bacterium]
MNGSAATRRDLSRVVDETWMDRVHFLPEVDSTNSVALQHARSTTTNLSELFFADHQRRGRGRSGNTWWSAEGALTFSVLLGELPIGNAQIPQVSLAAAVAICRALEPYVPQAELRFKWPNDVFLNQRKVGGILIESPARRPPRLVIGVGLNVNNPISVAPPAIRRHAISMIEVAGQHLDRVNILVDWLTQMDTCLEMLTSGDPALPKLWRTYSLLTGQWLRVKTSPAEITGTCLGIADDGALIIQSDTGANPGLQTCSSGVVAEFRPTR